MPLFLSGGESPMSVIFDEEAQVRVQMLKIIGVIAAALNVAAISGCFKSW
jgi:hypothetical protein